MVTTDESCTLLPKEATLKITPGLQDKIIAYFQVEKLYRGAAVAALRAALPKEARQWAKFRIADGGDTITSAGLSGDGNDRRDSTYVRVRLLFPLYIFPLLIVLPKV